MCVYLLDLWSLFYNIPHLKQLAILDCMHFCSCSVWLGWQLSLVEQFAYREGQNSCWDLYSTLLWWAGPAAGWKLGSWSSGLGCFSFLPDFDNHSVRGPFSLIQVLTPRALTRKVRGEIQGRLAWLLCYNSPKSPHQFPHRHYFFFFFTFLPSPLDMEHLVFFPPLGWLTRAIAAADFLFNPILPAFSLMEILHTVGP